MSLLFIDLRAALKFSNSNEQDHKHTFITSCRATNRNGFWILMILFDFLNGNVVNKMTNYWIIKTSSLEIASDRHVWLLLEWDERLSSDHRWQNLTEPQARIWHFCKSQYIAPHTCTEPPPWIVNSVTQSYRQRSYLLRQTRNRPSVGRRKKDIHLWKWSAPTEVFWSAGSCHSNSAVVRCSKRRLQSDGLDLGGEVTFPCLGNLLI